MSGHSSLETVIVDALESVPLDVAPAPTCGWSFTMTNGKPVGVRARVIDGTWLELVAPIKGIALSDPDDAWSLLARNDRLPGATRLGLTWEGRVELRADAFVGLDERSGERRREQTDPATVVHELCAAFRSALHSVHELALARFESDEKSIEDTHGAPRPQEAVAELVRLCAEAGWPAVERASGDVVVTIDTSHAAYQARISRNEEGVVRATVAWPEIAPASPIGRAAIAHLLLLLSSRVRLVKGVLLSGDGMAGAGVTAASEPKSTDAAIGRALSALSVACQLTGREMVSLTNDDLARAYLALFRPLNDEPAAAAQDPETEETSMESLEEENRTCLQQM